MLISLNWLKRYVDLSGISTDKLVDLISSRLVEVEEVIDLAEKYKGIKIVKVVSAERVKGSDHLSVCWIDPGVDSRIKSENDDSVKSEDDGLVQVVCGAPNVKAGMLAVWLAPGVVLPETYNKEPLVLDKRKLMGVESAGMLAAMDELDLGIDHAGIIEIDPADAKPGDDFAKVFELDDIIIDIENKSLTHRPDCFGVIGFAREVAGVLGQKFVEPEVIASEAKQSSNSNRMDSRIKSENDATLGSENDVVLESENGTLGIEIVDPKLCPRYSAAVIDGVSDKNSKYLSQMQVDIAKAGMRSIDRIVDITNYLMLLTGQPLHAFDYDKLLAVGGKKDAKIIVRAAKKGEKLELLDGKIVECGEKDILITSNNKPVALAGAMGGANTVIDKNTKRIIIESATFNLFNIRGSQFRHGIFSEAITRFTKGQPAGLTMPVLNETIKMIGGKVREVKDAYPEPIKTKPIIVEIEKINGVLGTNYDFNDIVMTLENVGFKVDVVSSDSSAKSRGSRIKSGMTGAAYLSIISPWWRTDIHIAEDVIEEVGRLSGYDNIPLDVPMRKFVAPKSDMLYDIKNKVREALSAMGANEVLTYSFVSEDLLKKVGQDPDNSYKITNSISPELQYVRQQLTPSLLEKVYENQKAGYDKFALFEMNQVFPKSEGMTDEGVPVVCPNLALILFDNKNTETGYYDVKAIIERMMEILNTDVIAKPVTKEFHLAPYYEPKRASELYCGDRRIGMIAEIKPSVLKKFKLPSGVAGFEIAVDYLYESIKNSKRTKSYKLSQYQDVKRDVTFKVNFDLECSKLANLICETLAKSLLWYECKLASIWQGDDKKTKNISFNLSFADYNKTLKSDEIADIMDKITSEVKKQLKGELV